MTLVEIDRIWINPELVCAVRLFHGAPGTLISLGHEWIKVDLPIEEVVSLLLGRAPAGSKRPVPGSGREGKEA